ncbi:MAG: hypothetical protein IJS01_07775 [Lentisphaeria bacterium]|nr:hypothetical protein [Lentisphaeria bacterium]
MRSWQRMMIGLLALAALVLPVAGCAVSQPQTADRESVPQAPGRRIRAALYVDNGSRSSGVLFWTQLLAYSPQLEFAPIDAKDIKGGALSRFDLLVIPGGSSRLQCETMTPEGMEKVREFVAAGGAYVGACAGFHCTLNKPDRLRLLPFVYRLGAGGDSAMLQAEISEKGAKLMGIRPGRYQVRYSHGPISKPGPQSGEGWGEVLGVYKSTIRRANNQGGDFYDAPAVIRGQFGKGKVIATSFHPESCESTHAIALGCVYAVTGVKPTPVYPKKNFRPLRVGYFSPGIVGKYCIEAMLALDKRPDLDVRFIDRMALKTEALRHLDVLIFPHGNEMVYKNLFGRDFTAARLTRFLDEGGIVLASGNGALSLPDHPRVRKLPADADFFPIVKAFL